MTSPIEAPSPAPPAGRASARAGAAGFTLLEMIIVLVVLGLIAGMVAARGSARGHGMETRGLVAEIVETLRGARGRAIASNRTILVAVDGERHRLTVTGGASLLLPPGLGVAAAAGPTGEPGSGPVGIRFEPDGSSSGGRIVLADGRHSTRIGIDWLTGRVSVTDVR